MIWIDYVLLAFLAVMIFGIGFFCGYVKDKKEVSDFCREAKEYYGKAEKRLNKAQELLDEAQELLDKAQNYYDEVHAELEAMAKRIVEE